MTESDEDYLSQLENSQDPEDRESAKKIREAQRTKVAESPLDKTRSIPQVVEKTEQPTTKTPRRGPY